MQTNLTRIHELPGQNPHLHMHPHAAHHSIHLTDVSYKPCSSWLIHPATGAPECTNPVHTSHTVFDNNLPHLTLSHFFSVPPLHTFMAGLHLTMLNGSCSVLLTRWCADRILALTGTIGVCVHGQLLGAGGKYWCRSKEGTSDKACIHSLHNNKLLLEHGM